MVSKASGLMKTMLLSCFQINKIVSNTPNLESLNLSYNPLAGITLEPKCTKAFFLVRSLGLNNTKVSWDTVLLLIRETPE